MVGNYASWCIITVWKPHWNYFKMFFFCNALVKCHNSKIVFVKSNTAFNSYYFLLKLLKMCSFKIQLKPPKYPRRNISWQMTTIAKKYKWSTKEEM